MAQLHSWIRRSAGLHAKIWAKRGAVCSKTQKYQLRGATKRNDAEKDPQVPVALLERAIAFFFAVRFGFSHVIKKHATCVF
jgi:hypothetical protein